MNGLGGVAALGYGGDGQILPSAGAVAPGPDPGKAGIGGNLCALARQPFGQRPQFLTDGLEQLIGLQAEGLTRLRQTARAFDGIGKLHLAQRAIAMIRDRGRVADDANTRILRVFLFVTRGRHAILPPPVNDGDVFRAQKPRLHGGIHRRHAAADHHDIAADRNGGAVGLLTQTGNEIDRVLNPRQILPRRVKRVNPGQPHPQKHRGKLGAQQIQLLVIARRLLGKSSSELK